VRAEEQSVHFQPGLRSNRTLKILDLSSCQLRDEGIRRIPDALVGNTMIDVWNITWNGITSVGLDDVTRLVEWTQLKTIDLVFQFITLFNDRASSQRFVTTLQHRKSRVEEIPGLGNLFLASNMSCVSNVKHSLTRNQQLNRVDSLLAHQPPPTTTPTTTTTTPQQHRHAGTMMLKTWHKVITNFATTVPHNDNTGASAIF
jgi:Leucine Rich repeat